MVIEKTLEDQTTLWFESVVDQIATAFNRLIQHLLVFLEFLPGYFENSLKSLISFYDSAVEFTSGAVSSIFTDFQIKLLELLLVILAIHLIAIYFAWKKYSAKISERFFKPSKSKEDFKVAIKELKLPLEHTPRL